MELYQLRTFVVVAEERHLTRASERLFISQPAVSAHIKALEQELGVKLFRRSAKGMELTREGETLLPRADAVLASARELLYLARAMGDELVGNFKLGLNTDVDFLRLNALLTCMLEKHPRVAVTLLHSTSARIAEQVVAGNWDAGFVFTPPRYPELAAMPLFTFRLHVAGHEKFREAMEHADWSDLARLPWIWTTANCPYHRLVRTIFDRRNLTPAQVIEADSEAVVRSLLGAGKGLALLREDEIDALAKNGGVAVWPGESHEVQAYFIYLLAREKDPLIRAVRHCVADMWAGTQLGPLPGNYACGEAESGEPAPKTERTETGKNDIADGKARKRAKQASAAPGDADGTIPERKSPNRKPSNRKPSERKAGQPAHGPDAEADPPA